MCAFFAYFFIHSAFHLYVFFHSCARSNTHLDVSQIFSNVLNDMLGCFLTFNALALQKKWIKDGRAVNKWRNHSEADYLFILVRYLGWRLKIAMK